MEAHARCFVEVPPLQLQQSPDDLPQRPDATLVAGFGKWKSTGRIVEKREKGIAIFAPCKYKTKVEDEKGEEKNVQQIRGFRVVHVFDITQTEGEELPDLDAVRPKLLDADAPDGIWDALVEQANAAGFEVIRNRRGSENGYCDFSHSRSRCDRMSPRRRQSRR